MLAFAMGFCYGLLLWTFAMDFLTAHRFNCPRTTGDPTPGWLAPRYQVTELRLGRDHLQQAQDWVAHCWPREACAALIGAFAGKAALVQIIAKLTNHSRTSGHFAVSKTDLGRLTSSLQEGQQYLGFFHSHRSGVTLSPSDVRCLRELGGISVVGNLPLPHGNESQREMEMAAYLVSDDGTITTLAITTKE